MQQGTRHSLVQLDCTILLGIENYFGNISCENLGSPRLVAGEQGWLLYQLNHEARLDCAFKSKV